MSHQARLVQLSTTDALTGWQLPATSVTPCNSDTPSRDQLPVNLTIKSQNIKKVFKFAIFNKKLALYAVSCSFNYLLNKHRQKVSMLKNHTPWFTVLGKEFPRGRAVAHPIAYKFVTNGLLTNGKIGTKQKTPRSGGGQGLLAFCCV